ncbi:MAG: DUF177 domain-containing protein [Lachnospiraceae bacterium]|nr:DUF177 domain-containing protein [Lachnospiraceae bacterium]
MLFDLSDVLTTEGKTAKIEVKPEVGTVSYQGNSYEKKESEPFFLTATNLGVGKVIVEGDFKLRLSGECDRCLTDTEFTVEAHVEREIDDCKGEDRGPDDENTDVLKGNLLDVETLINNEIFMNLPDKVLCKPDCKGLCPKCGANLNERDCGCDTFVPDPRMAAIKDIFNAKREV